MKLALFSFTEAGSRINLHIGTLLEEQGYFCEGYTINKGLSDRERGALQPLPSELKFWIGERWGEYAFLFIGAAGIAIRYIAPWVKDKFTDSAVLVMDEKGQYVIPLLSGHVGGAVELSEQIAQMIGAVPVLTTATDVQGRFAVDVFAKKNQLHIGNRNAAKAISAAVLQGERIGFYSSYPVSGQVPAEIQVCHSYEELHQFDAGFFIGTEVLWERENSHILVLTPKDIVVGLGCRRGVPREELEEQLQMLLGSLGLSDRQIAAFASVDIKANEKGIQELAKAHQVSFCTYTPEELREVKAVSPPSAFVESITGVDNVCERAARRHCPEGILIQAKTKMERVTFALIQKKIRIDF